MSLLSDEYSILHIQILNYFYNMAVSYTHLTLPTIA